MASRRDPSAAGTGKGLATDAAAVCTQVCTGSGEYSPDDALERLADALMGLPPADRARLADIIAGRGQSELADALRITLDDTVTA